MSEIPEDVKKTAREFLAEAVFAERDYLPLSQGEFAWWDDAVDAVARAILAERERCAKIAEAEKDNAPNSIFIQAVADVIAAAIRKGQG